MNISYGTQVRYFPHKPSARQIAELGMQHLDEAIAQGESGEGLPAEVTEIIDHTTVNLRIVDVNGVVHWRGSVFLCASQSAAPEDARYCVPV